MMLSNIIYAFPEISLILGILNLGILYLFENDSERVYAKVARFWLVVSLLMSVIFYQQSINSQYFANNAYVLLFKIMISVFAYIMMMLTPSWFASDNQTGCKYYALILCALAGANWLMSSVNLLALLFSYVLMMFVNYRLLDISSEKMPSMAAMRYMGTTSIIIIIFAGGFSYLNYILDGNVEFSSIAIYIAENQNSLSVYLSVVAVLIPFLYSLGITPFHVIAEDKTGKGILPVSHYFSMILPLAIWATFIKLNLTVFKPYAEYLMPVYAVFAICSVIFGAMGANARINLHRIYAYSSIYHFGIILLLISYFKPSASFAGFIYLLMYMISLNSLYLIFYSLKSYGEYMSSITSLSGLSQTRPFTTAALLISLFSFIGLPPLAGFIGQINFGNELINNSSYISLGIILFFLLILTKSYLEIIKTAYFEQKIKVYDSENKIVLIHTLLGIISITIITFNPWDIIQKLQDLFYVIFI